MGASSGTSMAGVDTLWSRTMEVRVSRLEASSSSASRCRHVSADTMCSCTRWLLALVSQPSIMRRQSNTALAVSVSCDGGLPHVCRCAMEASSHRIFCSRNSTCCVLAIGMPSASAASTAICTSCCGPPSITSVSSSGCSLAARRGLSVQCRRDTSLMAVTTASRTFRFLSSVRRASAGSRRRSTASSPRRHASAVASSAAAWRDSSAGDATSRCTTLSISNCVSSMAPTNCSTGSSSPRWRSPQGGPPPPPPPSSSSSIRYSVRASSPAQGRTPPSRMGSSVVRPTRLPCALQGHSVAVIWAMWAAGGVTGGAAMAPMNSGTMTSPVKWCPKARHVWRMVSQKAWRSISELSEG
mmetsp:Transcript_27278/g.70112  ORF Transcript_27278/g.70112 Transcript_27278/m.70112 type:complete len:355 (-) Transcript_27278:121-1185(-)